MCLKSFFKKINYNKNIGDIAQLGERLNGIQEVSGSNPLISTVKNIYLRGKNYLINLNILNFANNSKYDVKFFLEIRKKILQSKNHLFPIDGKYLIQNGMKEGPALGKVLKIIEDEWIANGFYVSKSRVKEIIKSK